MTTKLELRMCSDSAKQQNLWCPFWRNAVLHASALWARFGSGHTLTWLGNVLLYNGKNSVAVNAVVSLHFQSGSLPVLLSPAHSAHHQPSLRILVSTCDDFLNAGQCV